MGVEVVPFAADSFYMLIDSLQERRVTPWQGPEKLRSDQGVLKLPKDADSRRERIDIQNR